MPYTSPRFHLISHLQFRFLRGPIGDINIGFCCTEMSNCVVPPNALGELRPRAVPTSCESVIGMEDFEMQVEEIRNKIKEIVSNVANIPVEKITDGASYQDDLQLDSLSMLEVGVDVDYEFKLQLPEEELQGIATIQDSVDLVVAKLAERSDAAA